MNLDRRAISLLASLPVLTACEGELTMADAGAEGDAAPLPSVDASTPPSDVGLPDASDGDAAPVPSDGGATPTPRADGSTPGSAGGHRVVGYFSSWTVYGRDYHVADLPGAQLTHINYAFANIADGECALGDAYADTDKAYEGDSWEDGARRGSFHQLELLKARHPELRTLLSIGGWTWSGAFSDVAATDAGRRRFASSCVELMVQHGFDGLDVDWEYPVGGGLPGNGARPEDRQNYTALLWAMRDEMTARQALEARAESYLLTIAVGVAPSKRANLELPELAGPLDWINLMAYDFHGAWDATTGHNAALEAQDADPSTDAEVRDEWNVTSAVDGFLEAGVAGSQLVLGMPFYGRSFAGVVGGDEGLYGTATGPGPGTWEPGVVEWAEIRDRYLPDPAWVRHWDAQAQTPWLYNASTRELISYDDPTSLALKRDLALSRGLSGVMVWEMNSDDAEHTLIGTLN